MLPVYEQLVTRQQTILITGATGPIGGAPALALEYVSQMTGGKILPRPNV